MKQSIVISVLGHDSPGLVKALSKLIVAYQGDWVESRMASLAGQFAGILRVELPSENVENFKNALTQAAQADELGLKVLFEESAGLLKLKAEKQLKIELIGQDQPGIVHRISSALADIQASVDELETEVIEASMSGERLFKASIRLHIANEVATTTIREVLEALANELIVDIELTDSHD